MNTDPIADLLTRIRNAANARKEEFSVPHSNIKEGILKVMKEKGFIKEFSTVSEGNLQNMKVVLNPEKGKFHLKRVSKPGQRIYTKGKNLKKIYGGLGITVVSTSQGIMSAEQAKKLNIGGEVICEVY